MSSTPAVAAKYPSAQTRYRTWGHFSASTSQQRIIRARQIDRLTRLADGARFVLHHQDLHQLIATSSGERSGEGRISGRRYAEGPAAGAEGVHGQEAHQCASRARSSRHSSAVTWPAVPPSAPPTWFRIGCDEAGMHSRRRAERSLADLWVVILTLA